MFCMLCVYRLHSYSKVTWRKENHKEEEIHFQFLLKKKNLYISGPMQVKPMLFKGQLDI